MDTKKYKRKMNKKLMISIVMLVLVSIGSIAGIVTVLALSSRTIDSAMFVRFMAIDIDGEVEAAYRVGNSGSWTSMSGTTPHVFNASDAEGNAQMNPGNIALTSSNNFVEFRYTFRNFGDVDYTGLLTLDEADQNSNMEIQYKYNDAEYSTSSYGLVVEGVDTASADKIKTRGTEKYTEMIYYIKVSAKDLGKSGSYSSDFFWLLEKYEAVAGEEIIKLATCNYTSNGDGTYSAAYNGADISVATSSNVSSKAVNASNVWYVPSRLGSAAVTKVVKGNDLPANTKVVLTDEIKEIETGLFVGNLSLVSIVLSNSITSIAEYGFQKCTNLQEVVIGSGLTTIGNYAFDGCSGLQTVNVEDNSKLTTIGEYAFRNCKVMTTCSIPTSVTTIGKYAFDYCQGLTIFNFGEDVTIGRYSFGHCSNLVEISIAGKMTTTDAYSFSSCSKLKRVIINDINRYAESSFYRQDSSPHNVSGRELYYNGSLLTEVNLTDATSVGYMAFYNCSSIEKITLPNTITKIDGYAFYSCNKVNTIVLPEQLTTIGNYAFSNCYNISSINIPNSVTSISGNSFSNCYKLVEIYDNRSTPVTAGSHGISSDARILTSGTNSVVHQSVDGFQFFEYETGKYELFNYVGTKSEITIPTMYNGVEVSRIRKYAFRYNDIVTKVTIPKSISSIDIYAFANCTSLTDVIFDENNLIKDLADYLFYNSSKLKNVSLSYNVETVATNTFSGCSNLNYTTYSNCKYLGNSKNPYSVLVSCTSTSVTSVTISEGCVVILANVFKSNTKLTTVNMPNSVKSIGAYAFNGCTALSMLTMNSASNLNQIGNYAFQNCSSLSNITIPNTISSIGNYAFQNCTSLTNISLPSTLTTLGTYAFAGCSGLTSVTIERGITTIPDRTFEDCSSLTSIVIPEGVTKIGVGAFNRCKAMQSISIPSTVTSMGNYAFDSCAVYANSITIASGNTAYKATGNCLMEIATNKILWAGKNCVIPTDGSVTEIASYAFQDSLITSIVIPRSIKTIKSSAFLDCVNLQEITFESNSSLTTIESSAFKGCTALTGIVIPSSVTSLGGSLLNGCSSLQTVTINAQLSSLPTYLFSGCIGLKTVVLPNTLTSLPNSLFSGCTSLESFTIPNNVTTLGTSLFSGCTSLKSVTIPTSVTALPNSLFNSCTSLESFTIPDHITSIGTYLFSGCTGLKSFTLPTRFTTIPKGMFNGCTALQSFTVNSNVKTISDFAFQGCSSLTSMVLPEGLTTIGPDAFYNCSSLTSINIPNSIVNIAVMPIGSYSFTLSYRNNGYMSNLFDGCTSLNYTVYENCSYLGNSTNPYLLLAKCNNSSITSVNIHSQTKFINNGAFYNFDSLTSIVIPEGVECIGAYAFYSCGKLTNVTLPATLKTISYGVFYSCSSLSSVTFNDVDTWYVTSSTTLSLTNVALNATYLTSTYYYYKWTKDTTSGCGKYSVSWYTPPVPVNV